MPRDRTNDQDMESVAVSHRSEAERALAKLQQVVVDGLRHGFFDYTLTCETIGGKKRRLIIKAGKSHQFTIPLEEIEAI